MEPETVLNGELGRQLGKLEGNVDALNERVAAVSENLRELRRENSQDHGEVIRRLDGIRDELLGKAPVERVEAVEKRTDSLEATRDRDGGETDVGKLIVRTVYAAAVLIVAILGYFAGTGTL